MALLRDELRHLKQQMQSLQMEKILNNEATRNECKNELVELSKSVAAKEAELQLKSVEFSMLKMRHLNETRRIRNETQDMAMDDSIHMQNEHRVGQNSVARLNTLMKRKMMRLSALDENNNNNKCNISSLLFEPINSNKSKIKLHSLQFQTELEELQIILGKLLLIPSHQRHDAKDAESENIISKTIALIAKVFSEFWSYVHNLIYPKNCLGNQQSISLPYKINMHCIDSVDFTNQFNLLNPQQMSEDKHEPIICMRRFIVSLSILIQQMPKIALTICTYQHGEYLLLHILGDSIEKLGYSSDLHDHEVLLTAFANLLQSLLKSLSTAEEIAENQLETLLNLLKKIIFTRPNIWTMQELSLSMLECVQNQTMLNMLCCNSPADAFVYDRIRSSYKFSNDSCILQVNMHTISNIFFLNKRFFIY